MHRCWTRCQVSSVRPDTTVSEGLKGWLWQLTPGSESTISTPMVSLSLDGGAVVAGGARLRGGIICMEWGLDQLTILYLYHTPFSMDRLTLKG